MYSMEGDPRRTKANPGPMAVVVAVAAVSMLVNTQNMLERVRNHHYLWTSVGDVETLTSERSTMQSYRGSLQKLWNQRTL